MSKSSLTSFVFTNKSDVASAACLYLDPSGNIEALAGADVIQASVVDDTDGILYQGLINSGVIDLGKGDDSITGGISRSDQNSNTVGLQNDASGSIYGGGNKDSIGGQASGTAGCKGLVNLGLIDGGAGGDTIIGVAVGTNDYAWGISNGGSIYGGDGSDRIIGTSNTGSGIYNDVSGLIDAGRGSDALVAGSDLSFAISNGGTILMGEGNDEIDASKGGFYNYGLADLGSGSDVLKGFNIGNAGAYAGGSGIDKILLGDGTYLIDGATGVIAKDGTSSNMYSSGFERVGGLSGGLYAFATGTLTVTGGMATFAA